MVILLTCSFLFTFHRANGILPSSQGFQPDHADLALTMRQEHALPHCSSLTMIPWFGGSHVLLIFHIVGAAMSIHACCATVKRIFVSAGIDISSERTILTAEKFEQILSIKCHKGIRQFFIENMNEILTVDSYR